MAILTETVISKLYFADHELVRRFKMFGKLVNKSPDIAKFFHVSGQEFNPATSLKTFFCFWSSSQLTALRHRNFELFKKWVASGNLKLSHQIKIDKIDQSVIGPALSNRGDLIEILIKRFSEFQKVSH